MSSPIDKPLHGVLSVLPTPFTEDGQIDRASLEREIDWAFATKYGSAWSAKVVSQILKRNA